MFVDQLFKDHKFDYIYHLAAYAAEGRARQMLLNTS